MSTGREREGERVEEGRGVTRSEGEDAAKGYASGEVGKLPVSPTMEMETVRVEDPARVAALGGGAAEAKKGSGPRNPEQQRPLRSKPESFVELPEGLPVNKAQPIVIDSEMLREMKEEWREQEEREAAAAAARERERRERAMVTMRIPARRVAAAIVPGAIVITEAEGTEGTGAPELSEGAAVASSKRTRGSRRVWVIAVAAVAVGIGAAVVLSRGGGGSGEPAPSAATGKGEKDAVPGAVMRGNEKGEEGVEEAGSAVAGGSAASNATAAPAAPDVSAAPAMSGGPAVSTPKASETTSHVVPPQSATAVPPATTTAAPKATASPTAAPKATATPSTPSAASGAPIDRPAAPPDPYDKPNYD